MTKKLIDRFSKLKKELLNNLHTEDMIVFESSPVFCDNAKAIYDEFARRNKNNKYSFIWINTDLEAYVPQVKKNSKIVTCDLKTIIGRFKMDYYLHKAKMIVSSNQVFNKPRNKQYYFYASHGTALKDTSRYNSLPSFVDGCLSVSNYYVQYDSYNLNVDKNKVYPFGFPRTDYFFDDNHIDIENLFEKSGISKTVIWMPTYRQHKNGEIEASDIDFPIFHDQSSIIELNNYLLKNKVLLLILPHYAQRKMLLSFDGFSNIIHLDNAYLLKKEIELYQVIKETNALITDYSSIIIDYLLLDKPIGLCFEDYEIYKKKIGFVENAEKVFSAGMKIYSQKDFYIFFDSIIEEEDDNKIIRNTVKEEILEYYDGKSAERTVDFLCEKLKEII